MDRDARLYHGDDDENMVSSAQGKEMHSSVSGLSSIDSKRESHLRYRTRVFAAEYVTNYLLFPCL